MNVFYPRLLDGNLNVLRRIEPVRGSLDMELEPLSSAELELQPGDSIPERSWVAVFTAYGLAGIFRSKPQRDRYGERSTTVSLVHGATELNDWLTGKTDEDVQSAANTAIQTIFSSYHGSLWTLGTVSPTASVVYGLNNSGVLDALVDLMEQLPGYMVTFNQTVTPWTVNIVPRPSEVTAEGRLSRNIQSVEITRDDSSLYTKVYYGENNSYVQDTTAIQKYGVIEHRISESGYTDVQLAAMAQAYLDSHKAPKLSVSISAIDLSLITGEPLDQIALGSKYRLVIPDAETEENRVIEQIVCSVRYDDFLTNPNPQITLASDPETIITFLKQQRRSGGAGRAVKQLEEKVNNQYQHWTTENEVYKESVYKILGVELNDDGTVKYQYEYETDPVTGEPIIDPETGEPVIKVDPETGEPVIATDSAGNPIPVYNPDSDGSISGQVKQSAQSLETLYEKTGVNSLGESQTLYSKITQNATAISTEVVRATGAEGALGSRIQQEADKIGLVVELNNGQYVVKRAAIVAAINEDSSSTVTISADKINLSGYVTASEIFATDAEIGQYLKADNIIVTGKIRTAELQATNGAQIESGLEVSDGAVIGGGLIADSIAVGTSSSNTPLGNVVTGFGAVTPDPTTGVVTIPYSTFQYPTAGDNNQNINFNIADMAYYQNHVGIDTAILQYYTDDPDEAGEWTVSIPTITLNKQYGLIKVTSNKAVDDYFYIPINASNASGTASIDDITAQSITPDQTRTTVTIKATGTNVSDRTEDAVLTNTTYTDGGFTYPCVNLTLDNTVIGRISTQSTYTSGETAGRNATNVVKGTWSQGSITYTTNAPSPNASAPKTLTLTTDQDSSWTWTAGDGDSGNYQKQVYVKDSAVTNPILTEPVDMPDTKVVVGDQTKQDSWWKTTGDNAYKYVIPAFTATDYLSTDSSNQHGLATGTNNPTVIDPSEAIAHGFGICHDSIGLSESTQTLAAGASVTVYPKAKATKDAESATNITTAGITITAASAVDPKISRDEDWSSGSQKLKAGATGSDNLSVKIKSGAQTPNLTMTGTEITGISFDVLEDDGTTAGKDTGADITASINKTNATLQANYDSANSKFVVSRLSGNSFNIGLSNAIQIGINSLDIPVTIGSNVIGDPHYEGDGVYSLSATGTITVGSQGLTVSGTDTFTATDAIALGLRQAGENLTVSPTNQPSYDSAINVPEVGINSNGYYFIKIGSTSYKKFHAPSGGSVASDRWARYTEDIILTANDIGESTWLKYATYNTGTTESDPSKKTSINVDASAVYSAGFTAGRGGVVNVTKNGWNYGRTTFSPSAGNGSGITIDIDPVETLPGMSSATYIGTYSLKDTNNNQFIYPENNFHLYLDHYGTYVYLKTNNYAPSNSNVMARINVNAEPADEPRNVTSLSSIKLTASDISTSTWNPTITYDDTTTTDAIPLQIDASDVYTKGLTDGSRLNLEQLRVVTQPLTQNTTYTLYPSDHMNYMAGIQFDVNVPTVYRNAQRLTQTITLPASHKGTATVTGRYVQYDEGDNTDNFSVTIDASNVYQAGVSAGSGISIDHIKKSGNATFSANYKTVYFDATVYSSTTESAETALHTNQVSCNITDAWENGRSTGDAAGYQRGVTDGYTVVKSEISVATPSSGSNPYSDLDKEYVLSKNDKYFLIKITVRGVTKRIQIKLA